MRAHRASRRPSVEVLRLGHRPGRDPRLTTHLALAARALGAKRMYLNPSDGQLARRLEGVSRRWGGSFEVVGCDDWRAVVRDFDGTSVHLTMYGMPLERVVSRLKSRKRLLAVVGGAKVPSELFRLVSYNVAVGPQPHSEVSALALFLDRVLGPPGPGAWPGALQEIVPSARGKRVRGGTTR